MLHYIIKHKNQLNLCIGTGVADQFLQTIRDTIIIYTIFKVHISGLPFVLAIDLLEAEMGG